VCSSDLIEAETEVEAYAEFESDTEVEADAEGDTEFDIEFDTEFEAEIETDAKVEVEKKSLLDVAKLYEGDNFGAFEDEPDFADELAPELINAQENSEDLSLLCAAWKSPGITCADASILDSPLSPERVLITTANKCFKAGTRIFGRNATGVYVIIHKHNIDGAFALAKDFYNAVNEQFKTLAEDLQGDLLVGISSRADRKVSPERLINEAETALLKARSEKGHSIVAFRADPEKYREFVKDTSDTL
jgi:hypothetical protein